MPSPRKPFADNEGAPPDSVVAFVSRRLGSDFEPGYGYGSWVFLGRDAVLKIDPIKHRRGSFSADSVADGLDLAGVATPEILAAGEIEDHAWIEIGRIAGVPAYLTWLDYPRDVRRRFMQRLREALAEWVMLVPVGVSGGLVKSAFDALFTVESAREQLAGAIPFMPAEYATYSEAVLLKREALALEEGERPSVLVHGDLWLGNMIANEAGELVGLIDFGRAAMAPADAELDTLLRFWRFPWLYVPEEWEPRYRDALDYSLLSGIVADCTVGLSDEDAALRLAAYDLAYRLRKIADWGWSDEQERLLEAVVHDDTYRRVIEARS
ncbi:MAG: aminoglycoside phosphotransferase family protein [Chloroflexi bacterium]|nr:aminoglycoside phosphotransferase family protein [Chloroflexota bacterium]